jgi:hypothetical protein
LDPIREFIVSKSRSLYRNRDPDYLTPTENYMDYSDDACMEEFTPGQTERLTTAIATYRNLAPVPEPEPETPAPEPEAPAEEV